MRKLFLHGGVVKSSYPCADGRKPAAARDADLGGAAEQEGVSARYTTGPERLAHLIGTLQVPAGQRVAATRRRLSKPCGGHYASAGE